MPSDNEKPQASAGQDDELRRRLKRRRERRQARVELRGAEPPEPRKKLSTGRRGRLFDEEGREPEFRRPRRPVREGPKPERIPVKFDPAALDDSAEKVVRRLTSAGHEAYLVGGCVRDLLVGHRPKDFDVATSARPEEVRAIFRNSRIIGRRFRLVHVLFPAQHVIETATFRRNPPASSGATDEDLLIRSDNVFGEAHEDAQRRDFTINGLFYDVDERVVLDWVGGMQHIERRMVHTIGDPVVRFQEDPVRMLRAVKFAARIDFGISPEVYEAAVQCRGALAMAARPRLSEEILRLMRGGAAHRSIWLLWEMGMLDILLPELSSYLADAEDSAVWRMLSEVDRLTQKAGKAPDDIILWGALLLEPISEACEGAHDRLQAAYEFLEPVVERLNLPRRASDAVSRIVAHLPRMAHGRSARFKKSALYPLARQLLEMRGHAFQDSLEDDVAPEPEVFKGKGRSRRAPRKRAR